MSDPKRQGYTYAEAGVDIGKSARLVDTIRALAADTARPGADVEIGGFGGVFDLKAAGFRDPLLVATTDGVGTKLRIAIEVGRHDTVGIDLVAMCVNDLVAQGAEPLLFLDYLATARLDLDVAEHVVAGIARGCRTAGCALIGGETAEMPGMYRDADYDLAGFALGAVERDRLLPRAGIEPGDRLIGLASDGLHSNGFSLVRKLVMDHGLSYADAAPFARDATLGEALLTPTRIYAPAARAATATGAVKAIAHITGGGLTDNVPRILPEGRLAEIELAHWPVPRVFDWVTELGGVDEAEMLRTFNCGVGLVLVVAADDVARVVSRLEDIGEHAYEIGRVGATDTAARPSVVYSGRLETTTHAP